MLTILESTNYTRGGHFSKEMKTCIHIKTCTRIFIAVLFVITLNWKQLRYHSMGEWLRKHQIVAKIEKNKVGESNLPNTNVCCIAAVVKLYNVGRGIYT